MKSKRLLKSKSTKAVDSAVIEASESNQLSTIKLSSQEMDERMKKLRKACEQNFSVTTQLEMLDLIVEKGYCNPFLFSTTVAPDAIIFHHVCAACKIVCFQTAEELRPHEDWCGSSAGTGTGKYFRCDHCGRAYHNPEILSKHQKNCVAGSIVGSSIKQEQGEETSQEKSSNSQTVLASSSVGTSATSENSTKQSTGMVGTVNNQPSVLGTMVNVFQNPYDFTTVYAPDYRKFPHVCSNCHVVAMNSEERLRFHEDWCSLMLIPSKYTLGCSKCGLLFRCYISLNRHQQACRNSTVSPGRARKTKNGSLQGGRTVSQSALKNSSLIASISNKKSLGILQGQSGKTMPPGAAKNSFVNASNSIKNSSVIQPSSKVIVKCQQPNKKSTILADNLELKKSRKGRVNNLVTSKPLLADQQMQGSKLFVRFSKKITAKVSNYEHPREQRSANDLQIDSYVANNAMISTDVPSKTFSESEIQNANNSSKLQLKGTNQRNMDLDSLAASNIIIIKSINVENAQGVEANTSSLIHVKGDRFSKEVDRLGKRKQESVAAGSSETTKMLCPKISCKSAEAVVSPKTLKKKRKVSFDATTIFEKISDIEVSLVKKTISVESTLSLIKSRITDTPNKSIKRLINKSKAKIVGTKERNRKRSAAATTTNEAAVEQDDTKLGNNCPSIGADKTAVAITDSTGTTTSTIMLPSSMTTSSTADMVGTGIALAGVQTETVASKTVVVTPSIVTMAFASNFTALNSDSLLAAVATGDSIKSEGTKIKAVAAAASASKAVPASVSTSMAVPATASPSKAVTEVSATSKVVPASTSIRKAAAVAGSQNKVAVASLSKAVAEPLAKVAKNSSGSEMNKTLVIRNMETDQNSTIIIRNNSAANLSGDNVSAVVVMPNSAANVCPVCDRIVLSVEELIEHVSKEHNISYSIPTHNSEYIIRGGGSQDTGQFSGYVTARGSHSRQASCLDCLTLFDTRLALTQHKRFCPKKASNRFLCAICVLVFEDQKKYYEHIVTEHSKTKPSVTTDHGKTKPLFATELDKTKPSITTEHDKTILQATTDAVLKKVNIPSVSLPSCEGVSITSDIVGKQQQLQVLRKGLTADTSKQSDKADSVEQSMDSSNDSFGSNVIDLIAENDAVSAAIGQTFIIKQSQVGHDDSVKMLNSSSGDFGAHDVNKNDRKAVTSDVIGQSTIGLTANNNALNAVNNSVGSEKISQVNISAVSEKSNQILTKINSATCEGINQVTTKTNTTVSERVNQVNAKSNSSISEGINQATTKSYTTVSERVTEVLPKASYTAPGKTKQIETKTTESEQISLPESSSTGGLNQSSNPFDMVSALIKNSTPPEGGVVVGKVKEEITSGVLPQLMIYRKQLEEIFIKNGRQRVQLVSSLMPGADIYLVDSSTKQNAATNVSHAEAGIGIIRSSKCISDGTSSNLNQSDSKPPVSLVSKSSACDSNQNVVTPREQWMDCVEIKSEPIEVSPQNLLFEALHLVPRSLSDSESSETKEMRPTRCLRNSSRLARHDGNHINCGSTGKIGSRMPGSSENENKISVTPKTIGQSMVNSTVKSATKSINNLISQHAVKSTAKPLDNASIGATTQPAVKPANLIVVKPVNNSAGQLLLPPGLQHNSKLNISPRLNATVQPQPNPAGRAELVVSPTAQLIMKQPVSTSIQSEVNAIIQPIGRQVANTVSQSVLKPGVAVQPVFQPTVKPPVNVIHRSGVKSTSKPQISTSSVSSRKNVDNYNPSDTIAIIESSNTSSKDCVLASTVTPFVEEDVQVSRVTRAKRKSESLTTVPEEISEQKRKNAAECEAKQRFSSIGDSATRKSQKTPQDEHVSGNTATRRVSLRSSTQPTPGTSCDLGAQTNINSKSEADSKASTDKCSNTSSNAASMPQILPSAAKRRRVNDDNVDRVGSSKDQSRYVIDIGKSATHSDNTVVVANSANNFRVTRTKRQSIEQGKTATKEKCENAKELRAGNTSEQEKAGNLQKTETKEKGSNRKEKGSTSDERGNLQETEMSKGGSELRQCRNIRILEPVDDKTMKCIQCSELLTTMNSVATHRCG